MRGKRLGFSLDEIRAMVDLHDADPKQVSQLQLFLDKLRERKSLLTAQREDIDQVLTKKAAREAECKHLLNEKQTRAERSSN